MRCHKGRESVIYCKNLKQTQNGRCSGTSAKHRIRKKGRTRVKFEIIAGMITFDLSETNCMVTTARLTRFYVISIYRSQSWKNAFHSTTVNTAVQVLLDENVSSAQKCDICISLSINISKCGQILHINIYVYIYISIYLVEAYFMVVKPNVC